MTILVAIVYVGSTMIIKVLTCSFDAIVVTLTLDIAELLRRNVPATWCLSITWRWRSVRLSNYEARSCKSNSERWSYKSIEFHCELPPCV